MAYLAGVGIFVFGILLAWLSSHLKEIQRNQWSILERISQLEDLLNRGYDSPWYDRTRDSLERIERHIGSTDKS